MRTPLTTRVRRGLLSPPGVAVAIAAVTLVTVHAEGSGDVAYKNVVYACANETTGAVRLALPLPGTGTGATTAPPIGCLPGEKLVGWNQTGVPGAPGPVGPTGPAGPIGPLGPPGKDAPADELTHLSSRLAALEAMQFPTGLTGLQEFTEGGDFIPPTGVTKVLVEVWGSGGGGGGGGPTATGSTACTAGAGGGAGGYVRSIVPVTPNTGYQVVVGTGGTGGTGASASTAATPGSSGNASLFRLGGGAQTVMVTADGGTGGGEVNQTHPAGTRGVGGRGSALTSAIIRRGGDGGEAGSSQPVPNPLPGTVHTGVSRGSSRTSSAASSGTSFLGIDIPGLPLNLQQGAAPSAPHRSSVAQPVPVVTPSGSCSPGQPGLPVRGSIDPEERSQGGQGGAQGTSDSGLSGSAGQPGYVLLLW
jgi:hypothetical protein